MAEPAAQATKTAAETQPGELSEAERAERREKAMAAAQSCSWLTGVNPSSRPREVYRALRPRVTALEAEAEALRHSKPASEFSDDLRWLIDNFRLIRTDMEAFHELLRPLSRLPGVRTAKEESVPRVFVLARSLLAAAGDRIEESILADFVLAVEEIEPLRIDELGELLDGLKIAVLEALADLGSKAVAAFKADGSKAPNFGIGRLITSLRVIDEREWRGTLEPLSTIHRILLDDPAGIYGRMDFESREIYRQRVVEDRPAVGRE